MDIKKISEFDAGTPVAADLILFENGGAGKQAALSTLPISTAVQKALEGKAPSSHSHTNYVSAVSSSGGGNAVTGMSVNGNTLTFTKGKTFALSDHTHSGYASSSHTHSIYAPKHTYNVVNTSDVSNAITVPSMSVGEIKFINYEDSEYTRDIKTPAGGTYIYSQRTAPFYGKTISGNTVFATTGTAGCLLRIS